MRQVAVIVLAAGQGTRMKSDLHKVLHPIAGRPMLLHLLAAFERTAPTRTIVVVGDRAAQLEEALGGQGIEIVHQAERLGTAHAALQAREALRDFDGLVLVCFGDGPLLTPETVERVCAPFDEALAPMVVVLGFRPANPGAYGRIIAGADGVVRKMVEARDAAPDELAVDMCNAGLLVAEARDLWRLLASVGNDNAQREYYLPDVATNAIAEGARVVVIEADAEEVFGINSRAELAEAEAIWQRRRRVEAMADGATLIAPETVWFSWDTKIGRDVLLEPNIFFGPGVSVADGATIRAFSHVEGATVGVHAEVGPFARLRPGAVLGEKSKVGNFVEVKKTTMGAGAKANHLTYLGDAEVGAGANVGAGTITCNYDGFFKYKTEIGAGAFVGSNSALVAPVTIGPGAIVAAGSVITADVAPDALAVARGKQESKPGWAKGFRIMMAARKKT